MQPYVHHLLLRTSQFFFLNRGLHETMTVEDVACWLTWLKVKVLQMTLYQRLQVSILVFCFQIP